MRFTFLLLFITLGQHLFGQPTVSQSNAPSWVTKYEFGSISDTTETTDGYAYLLMSRQSHLESKEVYIKYVMKVTSEKGLSTVASINESFDPSFQKLIFHELNIIRNGKAINKLNPIKFDVIRREDDLARAIYDKTVNAIYNIPDVRVGDVVEYSYTRKGVNPVFDNYAFANLYMQYGIPVAKIAYKIISSPKRKLVFKEFGNTGTTPTKKKQGNLEITEWIKEDVTAILPDDQYPLWFDPYPHVQYSDFQSWSELKSWAQRMYQYPALNQSDLSVAISAIKESKKTNEEKIKECIRIAQGDIRYLSFSDGIHGYKPHDPQMIYSQKYGDCKDKSFMLSLMLSSLGVTSSPALVSTESGYKLEDQLPNPWAFNHCIVHFIHNDSAYWIDPTLPTQVGKLKSYYIPSYYNALVINDESIDLKPIPFGYKDSRIEIKEEYSMNEIGGNVTLKVQTTYYGDEADDIRGYFHTNSIEQINKDYLNFYAKDYSELNLVRDLDFSDDSLNNIVVATEEYLLKNFWKIDSENKTADIYPSILISYIKKPDTRVRTMPLLISHPRDILHTIKIRLPEEWNIEETKTNIESDAFEYQQTRRSTKNVITMLFHYRTKADYVETTNVQYHINRIDDVLKDTGYTIFTKRKGKETNSSNGYLFGLFALAIIAYFLWKNFRK